MKDLFTYFVFGVCVGLIALVFAVVGMVLSGLFS